MRVIEFLEARVAEDQVVADKGASCGDVDSYCAPDGRHPSPRLVAECQAKTAIIREYRQAEAQEQDDVSARIGAFAFRIAIHCLAQVYVDHPDFDPRWST